MRYAVPRSGVDGMRVKMRKVDLRRGMRRMSRWRREMMRRVMRLRRRSSCEDDDLQGGMREVTYSIWIPLVIGLVAFAIVWARYWYEHDYEYGYEHHDLFYDLRVCTGNAWRTSLRAHREYSLSGLRAFSKF